MPDQPAQPPAKLSRQQARAQERAKRDAQGWITTLNVQDPWTAKSIRGALGNRHVTRAELEQAIGISLADTSAPQPPPANSPTAEPDRITIQHVLISFAGAGTKATRTREAASLLAEETLQRARQGEAFDDLVATLTDDSAPGIYSLCNTQVAQCPAGEYPRIRMVPAFGDVGFSLAVGDIGMAPYDSTRSPYGWHIIKRLQ
jgi:hypothetical protein